MSERPYRRRANAAPDPTPDEIRLRAEAIQETWSERERTKRLICPPPQWLPPMLSPFDFGVSLTSSDLDMAAY
jgi:hypothetical protein